MNQNQQAFIGSLKDIVKESPIESEELIHIMQFDGKFIDFEESNQLINSYRIINDKVINYFNSIIVSASSILKLKKQTPSFLNVNQITVFDKNLETNFCKNNNIMCHIIKEYMNDRSNWKDPAFTVNNYSRIFKSRIDFSVPYLKRKSPIDKSEIETEKSADTTDSIFFDSVRIQIGKQTPTVIKFSNGKLILISSKKIIEIFDDQIKMILPRYYHLSNTAIEIFTKKGKSYFHNLLNSNNERFISMLQTFKPQIQTSIDVKRELDNWYTNKISNFEFLMKLNLASGRSMNEPSLYPIFPWTLTDFQSQHIQLKESKSYRQFSEHMASQNEDGKIQLSIYYQSNNFDFSTYEITEKSVLSYLSGYDPFKSINQHTTHINLEELFSRSIENGLATESIPEFYSVIDIFNHVDIVLPPYAQTSSSICSNPTRICIYLKE